MDIIDESVSDRYIIERIDEFIKNNNESQKQIQDFKSGPDEFSLLHISAENCRSKLCLYLIDSIQIGKWSFLDLIYQNFFINNSR